MQDFLVITFVALAAVFLGLKFKRFFSRGKASTSCGRCGCHDKKPDVTIGKH